MIQTIRVSTKDSALQSGKSAVDVALMMPNFDGGGAERMMIRMAKGLSDQGRRVELVVCSGSGPFRAEVDSEVRVVDLKANRVRRCLAPIVRYLRQRRPRAVLVTLDYMILTVLIARAVSGVPVRVVAREANHISARRLRSVKARLLSSGFLTMIRQADAIIAVSQGVADDVVRHGKVPRTKVHPIYNPLVDDDLMRRAELYVSHPFFAGEGPKVILAAGRLTEQKDFGTLLQAMTLLRARESLRLIILGEGPERVALEKFVRDNGLEGTVSLPGFVGNPFAFMRRSSVFVLSSAWEGLPGVLVQAMACGCPIVSTDCPSGPREILEDGRYGELVPVGEATALAEAIERTLNGSRNPEVLRRRAKEFSVERAVARYAEVLWP